MRMLGPVKSLQTFQLENQLDLQKPGEIRPIGSMGLIYLPTYIYHTN